jgi:hypothetical protein
LSRHVDRIARQDGWLHAVAVVFCAIAIAVVTVAVMILFWNLLHNNCFIIVILALVVLVVFVWRTVDVIFVVFVIGIIITVAKAMPASMPRWCWFCCR